MNPLSDEHDRLIDSLLEEAAGPRSVPDLTARVLASALAKPTRSIGMRWITSMAAALVLLGTGLIVWRGQPRPSSPAPAYPAPRATGAFLVAGGGNVIRGCQLKTNDQPASVVLGGYCTIELAAHTRLIVKGSDHAESIQLLQGQVTCSVDRGVGAFNVLSEIGTVSVHGTHFSVALKDLIDVLNFFPQGASRMQTRQLVVTVFTGAVMVSGQWGNALMTSGQQAFAAPPATTSAPADNELDSNPPPAPWNITHTQSVYFDPVIAALERLNFDGDTSFDLTPVQKQTIGAIRAEWKKVHDEFHFGPRRQAIRDEYLAAQNKADDLGCMKALQKERNYYRAQPNVEAYIKKLFDVLTEEQKQALDEELTRLESQPHPERDAYEEMLRIYELIPG